MNKAQYHKYLKSSDWTRVRKAVLHRDQYKCRLCNSGLDLNVHHRSYEFIGKELGQLVDLVSLCRRRHAMFHGKEVETPVPEQPLDPTRSITLNKHNLKVLACSGGFTKATLDILGVSNAQKGWKRKLHGKIINWDTYVRARDAKNIKSMR